MELNEHEFVRIPGTDCKELGEFVKKINVQSMVDEDVIVTNDSGLEMIGKGRQGAVFKLNDQVCMKVYGKIKDCQREYYAMQLGKKTDLIPDVYCKGPNYLTMEMVYGIDLREYLQSQPLNKELSLKLIQLLQTFKKIGYERIDHHKRQIFLQDDGSLKVIDVGRTVWRNRTYPYPRKLLTSLGNTHRAIFLEHVKELAPELYEEWEHYMEMDKKSRDLYQKLLDEVDTEKPKLKLDKLLTSKKKNEYDYRLDQLIRKVIKDEKSLMEDTMFQLKELQRLINELEQEEVVGVTEVTEAMNVDNSENKSEDEASNDDNKQQSKLTFQDAKKDDIEPAEQKEKENKFKSQEERKHSNSLDKDNVDKNEKQRKEKDEKNRLKGKMDRDQSKQEVKREKPKQKEKAESKQKNKEQIELVKNREKLGHNYNPLKDLLTQKSQVQGIDKNDEKLSETKDMKEKQPESTHKSEETKKQKNDKQNKKEKSQKKNEPTVSIEDRKKAKKEKEQKLKEEKMKRKAAKKQKQAQKNQPDPLGDLKKRIDERQSIAGSKEVDQSDKILKDNSVKRNKEDSKKKSKTKMARKKVKRRGGRR